MAATNRPDKVWSATLDNRYLCEVERTGEYTGELVILDTKQNNLELKREPVGLSYQAIFGPDIADVENWETRIIDFVDNLGK
jgi:hypothetical protein